MLSTLTTRTPARSPRSVYRYNAVVAYRDAEGKNQEEDFPIHAPDVQTANRLAFDYVLQALRLDDFELRVVGA